MLHPSHLLQDMKSQVNFRFVYSFFSGVIVKVGTAVTDFNVGDKVGAFTAFGGYAQFVRPFQHLLIYRWLLLL